MADTLCKNCGKPIRRSGYGAGFGTGWTHVNGIEFNGIDHCQTSYAEPVPEPHDSGLEPRD